MKIRDFLIKIEDKRRVDKFLAEENISFTRADFQKLIKAGKVKINGKSCQCADILHKNDSVVVEFPEKEKEVFEAEPFELPIIFEDDYILIINKPANLVVHPGSGNQQGTLANQLLGYLPEVFEPMVDDEKRPGIVHRLDKDTTGLMIIGKTSMVLGQLKSAFSGRNIKKDYLALVKGGVKNNKGVIDTWYGRDPRNRQKMAVLDEGDKDAVTRYRVLANHNGVSLVQVRLETGRTHQIRVHFNYLNNPLLGDATYATKDVASLAGRQMLHAWRLSLYHPITKKKIFFEAPIPKDIKRCAKKYNIQLV